VSMVPGGHDTVTPTSQDYVSASTMPASPSNLMVFLESS
jgi:hypothetical protein